MIELIVVAAYETESDQVVHRSEATQKGFSYDQFPTKMKDEGCVLSVKRRVANESDLEYFPKNIITSSLKLTPQKTGPLAALKESEEKHFEREVSKTS